MIVKIMEPRLGLYGITESTFKYAYTNLNNLFKDSDSCHLKIMPVFYIHKGKERGFEGSEMPCEQPFYTLFVKFDGKVSPCCGDTFGVIEVGNILKHSLEEIIKSNKLRILRKRLLDGDLQNKLPICYYCGARTDIDLSPFRNRLNEIIQE